MNNDDHTMLVNPLLDDERRLRNYDLLAHPNSQMAGVAYEVLEESLQYPLWHPSQDGHTKERWCGIKPELRWTIMARRTSTRRKMKEHYEFVGQSEVVGLMLIGGVIAFALWQVAWLIGMAVLAFIAFNVIGGSNMWQIIKRIPLLKHLWMRDEALAQATGYSLNHVPEHWEAKKIPANRKK